MLRRLTTTLCLAALPAFAQDRPNTILVLDGSGSMWGQIDGINKIVIAREVVGQILQDFPTDENLGLTVYGHRERGNCADIETIVPPGQGTLPAILDAVNGINPRGKTPMTDAIIAAAEALRYTEEAATVILVSDGIETCNPDPCAAARALEQAGVDFTAHVVGFDVTEPEALAQMQCLADETGGEFITASNADELTEALNQVTTTPEVVTYPVTFIATRGEGGPVDPNVLWDIADPDGLRVDGNVDTLTEGLVFQSPPYVFDLEPWSYFATAYGVAEDVSASASFQVIDGPLTVTVVLPELEPELIPVTFRAVIGAEDGPLITDLMIWSVLSEDGSVIEGERQNPFTFELPQGSHTMTAYWAAQEAEVSQQFIAAGEGREIVMVFPEPQESAAILAPASAPLGAMIEVGWDGPDLANDYIGIGPVGEGTWDNFTYTRDGNPLMLEMPPNAGAYEISYFLGDGREAIATRTIEVTEIPFDVIAPATAVAGDMVEIGWVGPDYTNDYIGIGPVGEGVWDNFTYTRDGNPLMLEMPPEPGDYEISYFLGQDRTLKVTVPITVTAPEYAILAPETALAGSTIEIGWTGPDYDNDYIGIGPVGEGAWDNFAYTRDGNPLDLVMPVEPGEYEISYFLGQDRTQTIAVPITVTALDYAITAPATAVAGSTIEVGWQGPDYDNDYIGIGPTGEGAWDNFTYTREGNPLPLLMPAQPGEYDISYFLGQDRALAVSVPITVTAFDVTLSAPASALEGETITVTWTGPDYDNDYIGIGPSGEQSWDNYTYTSEGNPLELVMPVEAGTYDIGYFLGQDRFFVTSVSIAVTPVEIALTAPATAVAGSTIEVGWVGPDYDNDYVGIGPAGEGAWDEYAYTRDGSLLQIDVPETPGEYEISYFFGQDRAQKFTVPLTVTAE